MSGKPQGSLANAWLGSAAEMPGLAEYMARHTGDAPPREALYCGFVDGNNITGCLMFYPLTQDTVMLGAAVTDRLRGSFSAMRRAVLEIAFLGLGYDHLAADIRLDNRQSALVAEHYGLRRVSSDGSVAHYRLGDCHEKQAQSC